MRDEEVGLFVGTGIGLRRWWGVESDLAAEFGGVMGVSVGLVFVGVLNV